ncbi:MAG: G-D-S-L family lipolytic protein [Gammaproteobacteria bacterium]|nr:G-D-S-L family lipolytic protein [Gammaproteobacteria bacterium]
MKTYLKKSLLVITTAIAVAGCGADISGSLDKDGDPGTADFSTFIAIGDSLTAGYADSALYRHGQENSYPAILAQQFALAGGGKFKQPLMPDGATGSLTLTGFGDLGRDDRLVLVGTGDPDSPLKPDTITPTQSTSIDVPEVGPFNNMGTPGATFYHLGIPTYGNAAALPNANPYFIRSASSTGASMLGDSLVQMPTFFVLWIGNNDVLSYATSGGTGVDQTGQRDVTLYGPNDITDPGFFENGGDGAATGLPSYQGVVTGLKGAGAKGVLINIADVATVPFFTTVPYDAIPLTADQAVALNGSLAASNNAAVNGAGLSAEETARRQLSYSAGQNPVLIVDENLTNIPALGPLAQARPATPDDFILLPASAKLGEEDPMATPPFDTWGISLPLEDADVLTGVNGATGLPTDSEFAIVDAARQQYNDIIEGVANGDPDLVLFDVDAKLRELNEDGIFYGTGGIFSDFVTGGAYSLDGVHPTARGYAVVAIEIMKVIEDGFGASLPPVDPGEYTTVFYQ